MAVVIDDFNRFIPKGAFGVNYAERRAFYAIFDGHGGGRCSDFLAKNFHLMLGKNPLIGEKPDEAIQQVWTEAEETFYEQCSKKYEKSRTEGDRANFRRDGSTATVVLVVGDQVLVANCGDSHVYLYCESKGPPKCLSDAHNTDNKKENERVEKSGAKVEQELVSVPTGMCCMRKKVPLGKLRVWPGGLAVTRSFGDFHAKIPTLGGIEGSVIADYGELRTLEIEEDWQGIIIASDGAWDALSPRQIWDHFWDTSQSYSGEASDRYREGLVKMVDECCDSEYWEQYGGSADNTTAIALVFQHIKPATKQDPGAENASDASAAQDPTGVDMAMQRQPRSSIDKENSSKEEAPETQEVSSPTKKPSRNRMQRKSVSFAE